MNSITLQPTYSVNGNTVTAIELKPAVLEGILCVYSANPKGVGAMTDILKKMVPKASIEYQSTNKTHSAFVVDGKTWGVIVPQKDVILLHTQDGKHYEFKFPYEVGMTIPF